VTALLVRLGEMGVRRVTVPTGTGQASLTRVQGKGRDSCAGGHPRRARFWEELGADGVVLESFSINRDFHRLGCHPQGGPLRSGLIANHVCLMNCPLRTFHQNGFAYASDETGTLLIDYCFMRCSRLRFDGSSPFINRLGFGRRTRRLGMMGYTSFKLLERDSIGGTDAASQSLHQRGSLAICRTAAVYGFKQPVRKESLWSLRHFWMPRQVSPRRLKPLLDVARLQGWLSPLPDCPIRVEARRSRRIPSRRRMPGSGMVPENPITS